MPLTKSFAAEITPVVSDTAYGAAWAGKRYTPTLGRVYTKIQSLALTDFLASVGANRIPYLNGSSVATSSAKLLFDGSDLFLKNPTPATVGSQLQNSPYLELDGEAWESGASITQKLRISNKPKINSTAHATSGLTVEAYDIGAAGWQEFFSIQQVASDVLTTRMKLANPQLGGWGGFIDCYYDGTFTFRNLSGGVSPLAFTVAGRSPSAFPTFGSYDYAPTLRAYFNDHILFAAGYPAIGGAYSEGANAGGSEYVQSNLPMTIGGTALPSSKLEVISTGENSRFSYNPSNYGNLSVSSAALLTWGGSSGARYRYDKPLERKAGNSTKYAQVGGKIFDYISDALTITTSAEDLYTDTLPANLFAEDGDLIEFNYAGFTAANNDDKYWFVEIDGSALFSSNPYNTNNGGWEVKGACIRSNSTTLLCQTTVTAGDQTNTQYSTVTGLDFTVPLDLTLRARTPDAAGDLTAKMGWVKWFPKA